MCVHCQVLILQQFCIPILSMLSLYRACHFHWLEYNDYHYHIIIFFVISKAVVTCDIKKIC